MSSWSGKGAATRVYMPQFDADFAALPTSVQQRIEEKLDAVGLRLAEFSHYRMTGSSDFRLRVGDYRIFYQIDVERNVMFLLAVGHRREIYR